MKTCLIDNEDSMSREAWQDGKLLCSISAMLLCTTGFRGDPSLSFILNAGPWTPGRVIGDNSARNE